MGAYADKMAGIAEAQAMADQQMGYTQTPYAYVPPDSFVVDENTIFTHFASPASPAQTFNAPAIGVASYPSNTYKSVSEVVHQQKPASSLPPSFTYEGPLGGAGLLGLFAPAPGSQKYKDFVAAQEAKEHYNPEKIGITPLPDNTRSTVVEIAKQTEGPNLWEKFSVAVQEGYASEPEEVNIFTKSIDQLRAASLGIVKPSNITLLVVGGLVLMVLLLK